MTWAHGGDLARIARETGIRAGDLLDFSANINPAGLPPRAAERLARDAADPSSLLHYPDPQAWELRSAISEYARVPGECIVVGPGAGALIHAVTQTVRPERVSVESPAFCEYERAARLYNAEIGSRPADLIVMNNPHNPTGRCLNREEMLSRISSAVGVVLIDEAFIDYVPEASITPDAARLPNVVALRSLTKFFGCPGLRVGYAVASPDMTKRIADVLPPWPVTTLALNALSEAVHDKAYIARTIAETRRARAALAAGLLDLGCIAEPASANFLLVRIPDAIAVRERLIREHRIVVRECESFAGLSGQNFVRIAVRTEADNARLLTALHDVLHLNRVS